MTARSRRRLWMGAVLGLAVLLVAGLLGWRFRGGDERWSTFLVGNPHAGAHTFEEKGCSRCHAVNGVGADQAPDLGFQRPVRSNLNQLVTEMWNHAPRMWAQMEAEHIPYPDFSTREMADLFSYLYTARYVDEPGDAARGQTLFARKGCLRCHAVGGQGGKIGPDLKELRPVDTPIFWAQSMWNHAPAMETRMQRLKMAWPHFDDGEMNDLLAFIRQERAGPRQEFELLPADPRRGWELFRQKGCIHCHAVGGEGGSTAPDLGPGRPLPPTLTQVAGRMWNHSPEMWKAMQAQGLERPAFKEKEMADLIAFLYSVRYFDLAGSALVGQQLFVERHCAGCHGPDACGGELGPDLRSRASIQTQVTLARALWAHGPPNVPPRPGVGVDLAGAEGERPRPSARLPQHPAGRAALAMPTGPSPRASWLLGFGVFFGLGYLLFGRLWLPGSPSQPIRYNHAVHIASGMNCVDCHVGARDQAHATLPGLDTCLMCHQEAVTESPEEEKIRAFATAGQEIPWEQVTRMPRHVYFSHRRHVALGDLECADCHGPMETRTEPPRRPFRPLNMDVCLECHEQKKVDNDCNRCHR